MQIIDAHTHIFSTLAGFGAEGELRAIGNGLARWATGREERIIPMGYGDKTFTSEALISIMNRYNIEKAVLLQGGLLGFDNNYLAEAMQKYPSRLTAAAAIDPFCRKRTQILDNLLKTFRIFKFEASTGCGLMGIHKTFDLAGAIMMELYESINEKNGVVVFDLGSPSDESHQMDAIVKITKAFPLLKIVICHLASYKQGDKKILQEELESVKDFDNIAFDIAALMWKTRPEQYPFPIAQDYIRHAKNIIGTSRLMWGTDSPTTLCRYSMEEMINCFKPIFNEKEEYSFFYGNANRIYFQE